MTVMLLLPIWRISRSSTSGRGAKSGNRFCCIASQSKSDLSRLGPDSVEQATSERFLPSGRGDELGARVPRVKLPRTVAVARLQLRNPGFLLHLASRVAPFWDIAIASARCRYLFLGFRLLFHRLGHGIRCLPGGAAARVS